MTSIVGTRILPAGLWAAVILTYLLVVVWTFAGHFEPTTMMGNKASQGMVLLIAVIMLAAFAVLVYRRHYPFQPLPGQISSYP